MFSSDWLAISTTSTNSLYLVFSYGASRPFVLHLSCYNGNWLSINRIIAFPNVKFVIFPPFLQDETRVGSSCANQYFGVRVLVIRILCILLRVWRYVDRSIWVTWWKGLSKSLVCVSHWNATNDIDSHVKHSTFGPVSRLREHYLYTRHF